MWKKTKTKTQKQWLQIDGQEIPLNIFLENRYSSRVAFGRKGLNIRLPHFLSQTEQNHQIDKFKLWAVNKATHRPALIEPFKIKHYETGEIISVRGNAYLLHLIEADVKNASSKINDAYIILKLPQSENYNEQQKQIPALISRAIAKQYFDWANNRLNYLNELHFQKRVKQLRLKYTHSVWGSCSTKNNINLSTRLLLAPDDIIDYVIIHELAHLIERNHSQHFWKLVANAMPGYKLKEKWLKRYGDTLDF